MLSATASASRENFTIYPCAYNRKKSFNLNKKEKCRLYQYKNGIGLTFKEIKCFVRKKSFSTGRDKQKITSEQPFF